MLSDFLTLELFFGSDQTALSLEELSKRYEPSKIFRAVTNGDLHQRILKLGPNAGIAIFWLTEQGREKALSENILPQGRELLT